MRYYVVTDDGQKFGPADVQTLNQWIAESRLLPTQMLEEEASGARFAARSVPGLNFPQPAQATYAPGPGAGPGAGPGTTYSGYARPVEDGSRDLTPAWVLFGVGLLGCCVVPYVSMVLAGIGVFFANRAKQRGHPQANTCFILNVVLLVLAILYFILILVAPAILASAGVPMRTR